MLTAEQEKFVADLFLLYQKNQAINALSAQRQVEEEALSVQYKVNEINIKRSDLVKKFNADTAQLRAEIDTIQKNLTK